MFIKMTAGFAGRDFSVSPGEVTDRFSDAEAERMIAAGFAVPEDIEKAVKKTPANAETADKKPTAKKAAK